MSWIVETAKAAQDHFAKNPKEVAFMKNLGSVFQVTYANRWRKGLSEYSYYLLKPYARPAQRYGIPGEILVLYAPYYDLQARSLMTIMEIQEQMKERVHPIWSILITDDPKTVENFHALTNGKELETYSVPFSRQELEEKGTIDYINTRLEKFIHGRDLFAFQSALQSDTFFFGRKETVSNLTSQVENGQNFGLFGLRKTGKTSVLLAAERYLEKLGSYKIVHIDCQSPGIYLMRWDALLAKINAELTGQPSTLLGSAEQVATFEKTVNESQQKILLVFDEIENISFDLSPAAHWKEDFLFFWGAIRAIHQSSKGKLIFGVAGVNPYIFDIPLIAGKDNPILLGVSPFYLWPLDEKSVKDMISTIGRFMGIEFEGRVYPWLFNQFGGHPFLVRKACSLICRKIKVQSGSHVAFEEFTSRENWLDEQIGKDILNILVVLAQHYPDEYDNLLLLSQGEQEWIQEMRVKQANTLSHIINYRIIKEKSNGKFEFVIGALERFLRVGGEALKNVVKVLNESTNPTAYDQLPLPNQLDLWARVGRARNSVETRMRILLHRALLFKYSEKKALQRVLDKFSAEKQKTLVGHSLSDLFSGQSKALYLKDVKEIILQEWELLKHIYGGDKKAFELKLDKLNSDGRADAHANPIDESAVLQVEAIAQDLIDQMSSFLE